MSLRGVARFAPRRSNLLARWGRRLFRNDAVFYFFIALFLLTSCAPAETATPSPQPTATIIPSIAPTSTVIPPTATRTISPTLTLTSTPVPCDPRVADFCIVDGHFLLQRPIQPPHNDSVERTYPYASTAGGTRDPHHGVEFENEFGTPVHAAADGAVVFAGPDDVAMYSPWREYYGNLIVIEHENDVFSLYAHLSKIDVLPGDSVTVGEKIGEAARRGEKRKSER